MLVQFFVVLLYSYWIYAYTETTIVSLSSSYEHTLYVDAAESYAYISDATGTLSKVDLTASSISVIYTRTAGNCYFVAADEVNSAIYSGGYNYWDKYSSLSSGGTSIRIFGKSGYNAQILDTTGSSAIWPKSSAVDRTNSVIYISDAASGSESSTAGAIWKMNFNPTSVSNFTKLSLVNQNSLTYTPGAPRGVALNPSKSVLYFTESEGNKVSKVDLSTLVVTNLVTSGVTRPVGITVDSVEAYAYVSVWGNPANALLKIDLTTYVSTNMVTTTSGVYTLQIDSSDSYIWMTASTALIKISLSSSAPTVAPTTKSPTVAPTTESPTSPTQVPTTKSPTQVPTKSPTEAPTTKSPTQVPTTKSPTQVPTESPTQVPTEVPTKSPTLAPTEAPIGESNTNSAGSSENSAQTDNIGAVAVVGVLPLSCLLYYIIKKRWNYSKADVTEIEVIPATNKTDGLYPTTSESNIQIQSASA